MIIDEFTSPGQIGNGHVYLPVKVAVEECRVHLTVNLSTAVLDLDAVKRLRSALRIAARMARRKP